MISHKQMRKESVNNELDVENPALNFTGPANQPILIPSVLCVMKLCQIVA